ncbi:MAG: M20/M25/M40 family metallo-hydrolase [Flammeovirgaceae bacterium]|nr:M20/M25/M40 family metallo-hydrolase [Flammeovirgaceae bacterium]
MELIQRAKTYYSDVASRCGAHREPPKDKWQEPPFSGTIKDGALWGRGSMDDKSSLIGIMEAVERLIAEGYKPSRTIYLAFGHVEELVGMMAPLEISKYLASQNVQALFTSEKGDLLWMDLYQACQSRCQW